MEAVVVREVELIERPWGGREGWAGSSEAGAAAVAAWSKRARERGGD